MSLRDTVFVDTTPPPLLLHHCPMFPPCHLVPAIADRWRDAWLIASWRV